MTTITGKKLTRLTRIMACSRYAKVLGRPNKCTCEQKPLQCSHSATISRAPARKVCHALPSFVERRVHLDRALLPRTGSGALVGQRRRRSPRAGEGQSHGTGESAPRRAEGAAAGH